MQLTVFGESHGPAVGVVLDGLAPGVPVDEAYVAGWLSRRRPCGRTDTARAEKDDFRILSGVYTLIWIDTFRFGFFRFLQKIVTELFSRVRAYICTLVRNV